MFLSHTNFKFCLPKNVGAIMKGLLQERWEWGAWRILLTGHAQHIPDTCPVEEPPTQYLIAVRTLTTSRHLSRSSFPSFYENTTRSISAVSITYILQHLVFRRLGRANIWLVELDSRRWSKKTYRPPKSTNYWQQWYTRALTTLVLSTAVMSSYLRARLPDIVISAQLSHVWSGCNKY